MMTVTQLRLGSGFPSVFVPFPVLLSSLDADHTSEFLISEFPFELRCLYLSDYLVRGMERLRDLTANVPSLLKFLGILLLLLLTQLNPN